MNRHLSTIDTDTNIVVQSISFNAHKRITKINKEISTNSISQINNLDNVWVEMHTSKNRDYLLGIIHTGIIFHSYLKQKKKKRQNKEAKTHER